MKEPSFVLDLRSPVYSVVCPVCCAFALAPCRSERRQEGPYPKGVTPPGVVLEAPHPERFALLEKTPTQNRVRGYIPCSHPSGCLNSEHTPGGLDADNRCPEHRIARGDLPPKRSE